MLLIGNLNLFVYFGINEGIQILTIVILAIVTVVYGLVLAIIPSEYIGGPSCSAESKGCCSLEEGGFICEKDSAQSCKLHVYVFGLSIN